MARAGQAATESSLAGCDDLLLRLGRSWQWPGQVWLQLNPPWPAMMISPSTRFVHTGTGTTYLLYSYIFGAK